ncbi:MAG: ribonuclease J [Clostridia bacterium]|nr:ribonuclease J [Clostridia bacterium]
MDYMSKLRIIPLGGVGEIGKNMTAFECDEDIIVVDCGSVFPKQDLLGIDLVIPDITYLERNRDRMRGYFVTHGHEDHIGAFPYIYPHVQAPIYGSRLTCALIHAKMEDHGVENVELNVVKALDVVRCGVFEVQFIHVSHSISGAFALAITCPAGTVIVTGDFKVDFSPNNGLVTDLNTLAAWGSKGVLALLAESTNVEKSGYTMSERQIGTTFRNLFKEVQGRLIIAMFASNLQRIQQIVDNCIEFRRKICFIGRSMISVTRLAMEIGELRIPKGILIDALDVDCYDDNQIVILTTGSQGEPMSGLTRMASNERKRMQIRSNDTVVISATPIPGNELMVAHVIDQIYRCGARVVYNRVADVHTSGHACQEELKLIHTLVKPRYFIPVHGEYRMLKMHAELAQSLGMPADRTIVLELGQALELSSDEANITGPIPTGTVMVDGLGVGDVGSVVLRDRKHLSQDGLIIVVIGIDQETGKVASGPELISRGFVYVRENEELIESVKAVVQTVLDRYPTIAPGDWNSIKNEIKDQLHAHISDLLKRSPMILPIIIGI